MTNPVELRASAKQAIPHPEAARDVSIASATTLITNLLRCVLWLIKQGIFVTGFHGRRGNGVDRVVITVSASPYLHRLFPECAWRQRRQDGALTIYTWFADRFGVLVEWEEVTCA